VGIHLIADMQNAMAFVTMYLQYIGFSDVEASSIFATNIFGGLVGNFIGGYLGDRMAAWSPDYGRSVN
jgi:MFS family permease